MHHLADLADGEGPGPPMAIPGPMADWSDDDSEHPPTKRSRHEAGYSDQTHLTDYDDANDPRVWTQQHLDAADIKNPDLLALTPPQTEPEDQRGLAGEVDPKGPMGLTPLMIASFRGGGLESHTDEDDKDGSAAVIQELIEQGAKLNAKMDRTGETSLHLAAR